MEGTEDHLFSKCMDLQHWLHGASTTRAFSLNVSINVGWIPMAYITLSLSRIHTIAPLSAHSAPLPSTGAPLPQAGLTPHCHPPRVAPVAPRSEAATQGPAAGSAKGAGGDAEEQGVQGTVDVPQGQRQVGLEHRVDREDRVWPHHHVHLHEWWGDVGEVADEERHQYSTWKANDKTI